MRCVECGSEMTTSIGDHAYREGGMDHVVLRDVTQHACAHCGERRVEIAAIGQLHRAIAVALAQKRARLVPSEVRFLRDYLGLTSQEFASRMGVAALQASRWTISDPMGPTAERLLRVLSAIGPLDRAGDAPDEAGRAAAASQAEAIHRHRALRDAIRSFPSMSGGSPTLPIFALRRLSGWDVTVQDPSK